MKELYISPDLKVLCFLPVEGIASGWGGWAAQKDQIDDNLSVGDVPGYDETIDPGEDL